MKIGIAVTTYRRDDSQSDDLTKRMLECVAQLSKNKNTVFLVDDGSSSEKHLEALDTVCAKYPNIHVERKLTNNGIAAAKNTSIRLIKDAGCDYGFLLDDDVNIHEDHFAEWYVYHMRQARIQHCGTFVSGEFKRINTHVVDHNGVPLLIYDKHSTGAVLAYSNHYIDEIGGFRIFSAKWGHEHIEWMQRGVECGLLPDYCDIAGGEFQISLSRLSKSSTYTQQEKNWCSRVNKNEWMNTPLEIYRPIVE